MKKNNLLKTIEKRITGKEEKEKTLRILSIDGGGVRGYFILYIAYMLKKEYNINLIDHFDLFIGTSVGAYIIIALLKETDIEYWMKLYETSEEKIFANKTKLTERIKVPFFGKYDNTNLVKELKKLAGEKKIKDVNLPKPWIITATNFSEGKPAIFGSKEIKGLNPKYMDMKLSDALIASSAAPAFFPPHYEKSNNTTFIDGGLWANNPSLVSLIFAFNSFNITAKNVELLSFATTKTDNKIFKVQKDVKSFLSPIENEFTELLNSVMLANQNFSNYAAELLLKDRHFRVSPVEPRVKATSLDKLTPEFIETVKMSYEIIKEDLVKFIKTGKNPNWKLGEEKRYN